MNNYNYGAPINEARQFNATEKYGYPDTSSEFLKIIAQHFPEISASIFRNKNEGLKSLVEYWKINQNIKNKNFEKNSDVLQTQSLAEFDKQKRYIVKSKAEKNLIFDGDIEKQLPKDVADAIKHLGLASLFSIKNRRLMAPHAMPDYVLHGDNYSSYLKNQELKPLSVNLFNHVLTDNKILNWRPPAGIIAILNGDKKNINRLPEIQIIKSYIRGNYSKKIHAIKKQIQKNNSPKELAKKVYGIKKYLQKKNRQINPDIGLNPRSFISAADFENHGILFDNLNAQNIRAHESKPDRIQKILGDIIDGGDVANKKNLAKYARVPKKYIDDYL